jgi:hypothetical protein
LHHADGFEELGIRTDCNLVTVVVDVGNGVGGAGSDGGEALLKFFERERAG